MKDEDLNRLFGAGQGRTSADTAMQATVGCWCVIIFGSILAFLAALSWLGG